MRELFRFNDIFQEMHHMQEEMNRLMQRLHPIALESKMTGRKLREPVTSVKETESQVVTDIELPGMNKEDIQLHVTPHKVEVKATLKQEKKKEGSYATAERSFYRMFSLPAEVDPDSTDASYKNGVLHLKMNKTKLPATKQIQIK